MNSEKMIDCQGLPCPQPVLRCKEIVEKNHPQKIRIVLDNDPALENVSRFLSLQGYELDKPQKDGSSWVVSAHKRDDSTQQEDNPVAQDKSLSRRTMILITRDKMGEGDDELGSKLMLNFLATLPEMGESLWMMVMVNSGVKLAIEGSLALDSLLKLENEGVSILVCGTCLEFFGLTEGKRTGQTTNMLDIISGMNMADKVITL